MRDRLRKATPRAREHLAIVYPNGTQVRVSCDRCAQREASGKCALGMGLVDDYFGCAFFRLKLAASPSV